MQTAMHPAFKQKLAVLAALLERSKSVRAEAHAKISQTAPRYQACGNGATWDVLEIATGAKHSVRQLLDLAFAHAGLNADDHVEIDPALLRPAEVNTLCGDASKARAQLGWEPEVGFDALIRMMVDADLERVRRETEAAPLDSVPK